MKQVISPQEARKLVSDFGWGMIQKGFVWYSKGMNFTVYKGGYLYFKKPCNPRW